MTLYVRDDFHRRRSVIVASGDSVADTEIGGVRKVKGGTGDKSGSRCRRAGAGPGTRRRSRLSSVMATPSRNESVLVQVRSVFCSWVRERSRAPVRLAT